jgi:hypothetical protein
VPSPVIEGLNSSHNDFGLLRGLACLLQREYKRVAW